MQERCFNLPKSRLVEFYCSWIKIDYTILFNQLYIREKSLSAWYYKKKHPHPPVWSPLTLHISRITPGTSTSYLYLKLLLEAITYFAAPSLPILQKFVIIPNMLSCHQFIFSFRLFWLTFINILFLC